MSNKCENGNTLNGIWKVDYAPNYDEKSNVRNATDFVDEGNSEFCWYRLPCGICTKTNSMCPLYKGRAELVVTCKE